MSKLNAQLLRLLDRRGWRVAPNVDWRRVDVRGVRLQTREDGGVVIVAVIEALTNDRLLRIRIPVGPEGLRPILGALVRLESEVSLESHAEPVSALAASCPGAAIEIARRSPAAAPPARREPSKPELPKEKRLRQLRRLAAEMTYRKVAAFDCHLAALVEQKIRLKSKRDAGRAEAAFKDSDTPLVIDARGRIVGIDQGGDLWADERVAKIAHLLHPSSFVLAVDDEGRFWKWVFDGETLSFVRSRKCREALRYL